MSIKYKFYSVLIVLVFLTPISIFSHHKCRWFLSDLNFKNHPYKKGLYERIKELDEKIEIIRDQLKKGMSTTITEADEKLNFKIIEDFDLDLLGDIFKTKTFLGVSFPSRLEYAIKHPLTKRADILNRQSAVTELVKNQKTITIPFLKAVEDISKLGNQYFQATFSQSLINPTFRNVPTSSRVARVYQTIGGIHYSDYNHEHEYTDSFEAGLALLWEDPAAIERIYGDKIDSTLLKSCRERLIELSTALKGSPSKNLQKLGEAMSLIDKKTSIPEDMKPGFKELAIDKLKKNKLNRQASEEELLLQQFAFNYLQVLGGLKEFDLYLSLAKPMLVSRTKAYYSLPNILAEDSKTFIKAKNAHHPYVLHDKGEKSVPNNIQLGLNKDASMYTLMGPNKRGKSTYLKTVGNYIIMGRMGGPVPAKEASIKPVDIISNMNLGGDIVSSESLFSSQVEKALSILEHLKKIKDKTNSIVFIDELFTGTTELQQLAIGKAFIEELAKLGYVGIITTQNAKMQEIQVPGLQHTHNTRNYKIKPGPSPEQDRNAIEILEEEGASEAFIKRAREIEAQLIEEERIKDLLYRNFQDNQ